MVSCVEQFHTKKAVLYLGDSCEALREIPDDSVHYAVFSPPFASLYTYSNSERDLGNCRTREEFFEHYRFVAKELFRILKPGRNLSFHCMNLPATKERDGYIGIHDFRGDLIRSHIGEDAYGLYRSIAVFRARADLASSIGELARASRLRNACDVMEQDLKSFPASSEMIFHSEVCIWKDPVTAMQRTKAIGLLYKQLRKDSRLSRQGIPDYLVTMRKPGDNTEPITKTHEGFPVGKWQNYASPVWMDINPSDTLQRESAREDNDERHICPLQLQVIERGIELWTNPGDVVFSPFAGIGSEGYVSLRNDRKFIGVELKESYFKQACSNLASAEAAKPQLLFSETA